jgi:hypothetical protein
LATNVQSCGILSLIRYFFPQVVSSQEKQKLLDKQDLTPDGRFPCRFPGCQHSFKYDGKSRIKHESKHQPAPVSQKRLADEDTDTVQSVPQPGPTGKDTDHTVQTAYMENPDATIHDAPELSCVKQDDVYNYNCALLTDGLFFLNFLDAVAEGDGARIMRQYAYLLLYCKADNNHSTKYALECLYQLFLTKALLSPRDVERFTWNRTVNNCGKKGKNIAMDFAC